MKILQVLVLVLVLFFTLNKTNGQDKIEPLVLVSGTVKFNKKFAESAYVQFTDEKNFVYSTKAINGKYKLQLSVGKYNVFATGGTNRCNFVGCSPEFYKNNFLITKKRKIKFDIVVDYVGEG